MAKKNNYWGLVAVGALTAAAAGAVAAHLVKNHRKNNIPEDDFEDLDDFESARTGRGNKRNRRMTGSADSTNLR